MKGTLLSIFSSVKQYPRELVLAAVAMVGFMVQIENVGELEELGLHVALSALLSMNISLAATILVRSTKVDPVVGWGGWAVLSGVLSWYVFGLGFVSSADAFSYGYLVCLVHLMVILSWTAYGSVDRFWNASTTMLFRLLYAFVFSSILETGLGLSIAAIRFLFGFEGLAGLQGYSAVFVFVGFNTMFFLSGMPTLESIDEEPRINTLTSIFSRYVLAPLILVFIVILWAYGVKMLLGDMKEDMANYVVILVGGSTFTLLLTWPMRAVTTFPWKILHRYVMPVLLPLIGLALWIWSTHLTKEGIDPGGFTIAALLVVSLIVALGTIIKRTIDPRLPALALFCVAALTSVGPFGVGSVSERSMQARGKSLEQTTPADSAVAKETDSVRTSMPAYGLQSIADENSWMTSFVINDLIEGDTLTLRSSDGSASVRIPRSSTMVSLINSATNDTLMFDAMGLLGTSNDSLHSMTIQGRDLRTRVLASDVTIIRRNGKWSVSRLAASTHSLRTRPSK